MSRLIYSAFHSAFEGCRGVNMECDDGNDLVYATQSKIGEGGGGRGRRRKKWRDIYPLLKVKPLFKLMHRCLSFNE